MPHRPEPSGPRVTVVTVHRIAPTAVGRPWGDAILVGSRAGVAQSVEQRIRNAKVTSSIPVSGTNRNKHLGQLFGVGLFVFWLRVATV